MKDIIDDKKSFITGAIYINVYMGTGVDTWKKNRSNAYGRIPWYKCTQREPNL